MFGRIDWDDRLLGAIFLLSSAVSVGLVTVPNTTVFTDVLFSFGPSDALVEITVSRVISLGALAATIATNRTDFSSLVGLEWWAAIVTIGLVVSPPFAPIIDHFISASPVAGAVALGIQAGGYATISYLG